MKQKRKEFLKTLGLSAGAVLASHPISAMASGEDGPTRHGEASSRFTVSILQTTDIHCQVHPHDELFWENDRSVFRKTGGYARLATFFKQYRKKHQHTFLIDTGDMFQGSELSHRTIGKAFVPILNALPYDLYLPGNWEVVYGKKNMQTLLGALYAPKICANMYHDLGNGRRGELIFPPYHIWTVNGVKIGFIGYTDHLVPIRQSPNYSKGIFYSKPEENLAHYIDVLRNQEQCAYVIIIAHIGLSQQIHLANQPVCEGVDYILGGDTHERVRQPIVCKYAKVVEPGAFGSFVGELKLTIENGKVVKDEYALLEISADKYRPDKKIEKLIHELEAPFLHDMQQVIGYSTVPLYRYFVIENTIDTLILDALQWQIREADIVLSNGFRFCPPRVTPDHTGHIPITASYLFDMLPIDSPVRTAKATGRQIMDWLERELNNVFAEDASERLGGWVVKFKGMRVFFNAYGEKGKRVQQVTVGDKPIELDRTYTICACERDGDPDDMLCRLKGVREGKNTPFALHQVLKNYLAANSPVTPLPQRNAVALDAPDTLLTQVRGVDYQFR
ncbi:MAG: bifunctional metallophosphatase/5'-nucleotidase [Chitinophagales bacterium]|nr:bifunctional metallophosphatase/5'-nucleotidase [Chitinophagales bacterium]MDW8418524.1 bifunctional metallophosphatase/5'-nucleotidase [Chitinophagales bacterium]